MTRLFDRLKTALFRRFYRHSNRRAWAGHEAPPLKTSQLQLPGPLGTIPVRMYHGSANRPVVLYFHGGGWVIGDLETHDPYCRRLCDASGCTVLAVDYRLAPKHPFPAAHDDCLAASEWLMANRDSIAPNNGYVVLAGDSAGANLALCTTLAMRASQSISGVLMIYPVTQHYHSDLPSYREEARTGPLTAGIMRWFIDTYLGDIAPAGPESERLFPARRQRFRHFPPSLLITAERDPLRDDGRRLALQLERDGVLLEHHHFDQEAHGFACSEGPTPAFERALQQTTDWLARFSQG